ncbi:MAG: hypothetical protein LBI57_05305, partial [Helicobacteraceae bacterium]|nr:hypothetical protein [Helicobacteraceae bacterium]
MLYFKLCTFWLEATVKSPNNTDEHPLKPKAITLRATRQTRCLIRRYFNALARRCWGGGGGG